MNTIHLGNYEEFFVLYMDNELSEEQVKLVDDFLAVNPDLRSEFEILLSTKLPLEEFNFDKQDLLAESMKLTSVDEELLLYIDNELPADKKKTIQLELASNKDYRLQHQVLLQTKPDPSEHIAYPNKKELYRRTERVIAFRPWMRVAAAVVIIAVGGILYFRNSPSTIATTNPQTTVNVNTPDQKNTVEKDELSGHGNSFNGSTKNTVAVNSSPKAQTKQDQKAESSIKKEKNSTQHNLVLTTPKVQEDSTYERQKVKRILDETNNTIASVDHKDFLNTGNVTSLNPDRTIIRTPEETKTPGEPIASNDRKGSVKGFLRKATRMIEKRTGFDPANENGELLIGAVAISLK